MNKWIKSSHSNPGGNCVETQTVKAGIKVRDSMNKGGATLGFSSVSWSAFTAMIRKEAT